MAWHGVASSAACAVGVADGRAESNPYAAAVMEPRYDIFCPPYAMLYVGVPKILSGKVRKQAQEGLASWQQGASRQAPGQVERPINSRATGQQPTPDGGKNRGHLLYSSYPSLKTHHFFQKVRILQILIT